MFTLHEVRDKAVAAVRRGDVAGLVATYHPDAVLTAPEGRFTGRDQIRVFWRSQLEPFSDHEVSVVTTCETADTLILEWTYCATHTGPLELPGGAPLPATGKRLTQRGIGVSVVVDGLITEERLYYDLAELLGQLGLLAEGRA
jgi:steroid delta-isomerase-like uncharacterized protein